MENRENITKNCFGDGKSENLTEYAIHANISKIDVYKIMSKFDSSPVTSRSNQSFVHETGFTLVNDTRQIVNETMKEIKLTNQRNDTRYDNNSDPMREKRMAHQHSFAAPADVEHIPRLQVPDVLVFEKQEIVNISIFGNSM